jgi:hypothetical protein
LILLRFAPIAAAAPRATHGQQQLELEHAAAAARGAYVAIKNFVMIDIA